ncbi:MAG: Flp pilus assembly protein CpaB [Deltaproteobacteria bacterium]|jgi:pilus assembly protein CpaB|nr:Flp pilus assembly protein CpaB [Deltaproteobacteria bacterium]
MDRRAKIFLALAALCGLATTGIARNVIEQQATPIATVPVLMAAEELPLGMATSAAPTRVAQWPRALAPDGVLANAAALQGRVLARTIAAGEPILASALLPEGKGAGMDAVIGAEMRAVSVKVDQVIGVAGFLQPGSRVDVFATRKHSSGSGEERVHESRSRAVLENVRVLAVDERVVRNEGGPDEEIKVVTLEIESAEVAGLATAEQGGRIKLALRGQGDDEETARGVQMLLGTDVHEVRF